MENISSYVSQGGMTMHRIRRVGFLLLFLVLCASMSPVRAQDIAQSKVQLYIQQKGLNFRPGSTAYVRFLKDVLWGRYPDLEDESILTYASQMVGGGTAAVLPPGTKLGEPPRQISPLFSKYDRGRAVAYAYAWAQNKGKKRNPAYPDFGENDCTNFISQAVHAGGVSLTGEGLCGSSNTENEWYSNRASWWCPNRFAWTASWVNVSHFWRYQTQSTHNAVYWVYEIHERDQLRMDALPGDVIQLQRTVGGAKWHSMMVTRKEYGEIYLTYHSGLDGVDFVDNPLKEIRDKDVRYWLLRF